MSESITEANDNSFKDDVLSADIPVLVDFWAPWCGPCKSIAPLLEEIAAEKAGKLKIVKVNVDHNPMTASEYNVRGIPNLILFKDGQQIDQAVGYLKKNELDEFINKNIS